MKLLVYFVHLYLRMIPLFEQEYFKVFTPGICKLLQGSNLFPSFFGASCRVSLSLHELDIGASTLHAYRRGGHRGQTCPEILVGVMDVSIRILVLDTSIFMHFFDMYCDL